MSERFLRRSLLYTPGSSMKMLTKAESSTADAVIMDLEDAVSVTEKDSARANVTEMIPRLRREQREVIVRVNAMDSAWGLRDLLAVIPQRPDAVIVPKADERALITADSVITAIESESGLAHGAVKLIPLFETTESIVHAYDILGASPRIDGVQLGAEDLTKEQEIERTAQGAEIEYARQTLAFAARARGIDIIDTPYTGVRDLDGLRRDAEHAKAVGFTGKTCIHPDHIATVNEVFSPSAEAVEHSRGVVAALEQGAAEGRGAVMYNGKMVDAPVAERARRILERHSRIEKTKQSKGAD